MAVGAEPAIEPLVSGRKCMRCKGRRPHRWSAEGSVCYKCWKELGKPKKPGVDEDIPPQLQALRLAMKWRDAEKLPEHPMIKFYVELARSNPRDVALQWERMEADYKGGKPSGVVVAGAEPAAGESVQPDEVTGETLLPLCERLLVECVERGREEAGKLRGKS